MNTFEIITEFKKHNVVPYVDGDQLKLMGDTENLSTAFIEKIRAGKSELIAFLCNYAEPPGRDTVPSTHKQSNYPVSNAQKRLWLLTQLEGGSEAYNIVTGFYLKGTVHNEIFQRAFVSTILRHESLRTTFKEIDGELYQQIWDNPAFEIEFKDIEHMANSKVYLKEEVEKSYRLNINLEKEIPIRVKLFKISAREYAMIVVVHHIASDGWSMGVLLQDVMKFYNAFCKDEEPGLDNLDIQYKDYVHWLDQRIKGRVNLPAREFWQNEFRSPAEPLDLPADYARPLIKNFAGAVSRFYLDNDFYMGIQSFCKKHKVTTFNFLRATLTILLGRLSGQNDITLGTPVSGRNHADLENQIGLYVNTLPLRERINWEDSFIDFLKKVSEHATKAWEHQEYPLDKVVEDVNVKRDGSRNPFFDVMMVLQNIAIGNGRIDLQKQSGFDLFKLDRYLYEGLPTTFENVPSKFDLCFNFSTDTDHGFCLEIEYATRLYHKDRIARLFDTYCYIISQAVYWPEEKLKKIEIVGPKEQRRILEEFNDTDVAYPQDRTIIDLFEEQVRQSPDDVALLFDNTQLTYGQLNEKANQLGAYLRKQYGITAGDLVGLKLQRNEWLVVAILGVQKAGGAYVPIDPAYPQQRIDYMINDSNCKLLVDETLLDQFIKEQDSYCCDDLEKITTTNDLAYVIYTSGSTGNPKGVMIAHQSVNAFINWCKQEFAASSFDLVLAATSICFDLSIFEIFYPLCSGRKFRLLTNALTIPLYLNTSEKILLNTVPSVVGTLLEEQVDLSAVTVLNMAGEPIPKKYISQLDCKRIEVRNLYGPLRRYHIQHRIPHRKWCFHPYRQANR